MRSPFPRLLPFALLAALVACAPASSSAPSAAKPAAAARAPAAASQADEQFYQGKTVRIVVGYAAGAAYDRIARSLARYLPKHVPGSPTIVVENMVGAGSTVAANYVYRAAPRNGTVIGNFNSLLVLQQLMAGPGIEFDAAQFNWLGSTQDTRTVCMVRKSTGVRTLANLLGPSGKEVSMGAAAPGSNSWDYPAILKELGAKIRLVGGYDGQAKTYLAIEQGEVDGTCSTWEAMRVSAARLFDDGLVSVFVQMGLQKAADLPDVPLVGEYLKTDEQRALISALASVDRMTRPFALPPEVPADRVATLRKAFLDTMNDPEFQQEAEKARDELAPKSGEEVAEIVRGILGTPRSVIDDLKRITTP